VPKKEKKLVSSSLLGTKGDIRGGKGESSISKQKEEKKRIFPH